MAKAAMSSQLPITFSNTTFSILFIIVSLSLPCRILLGAYQLTFNCWVPTAVRQGSISGNQPHKMQGLMCPDFPLLTSIKARNGK